MFGRLSLFSLRMTGRCPVGAASANTNNSLRLFSDSPEGQSWNWVPPRQTDESMQGLYTIPVEKGVPLPAEEVKKALESQGADDVIILPLIEKQLNIEKFVIASGKSARHLRKMANSLTVAMKARELTSVKRTTVIEGDQDDDWQLVDCQSFLVHLLLPDTRKRIDLESHWSMHERPVIAYNKNENEYEKQFSKLLDEYPLPEEDEADGSLKPAPSIKVKKL